MRAIGLLLRAGRRNVVGSGSREAGVRHLSFECGGNLDGGASKKPGNVLITGAHGCIGYAVYKRLLEGGHGIIMATSRDPKSYVPDFGVQYIQADFTNQETHESDYWKHVFKEYEVSCVVNTAGGAYVPKAQRKNGTNLADINLHPVVAMAKAIKGTDTSLVQLSSMAAIKGGASEYSDTKKETEEQIADILQDKAFWAIIRPDLVFSLRFVSMRHAFSPNEIATLPFVTPILGSGNQKVQPVALRDLTSAIVQVVENPEEHTGKIVNAVGPEIISQNGLMTMFKDARGETYRPIHIDWNSAAAGLILKLAEKVPLGAFNPSLIKALRHGDEYPSVAGFDSEPFRQIAGCKQLHTLSETLRRDDLRFVMPPVRQLAKDIFERPDALEVALELTGAMIVPAFKAMFKGGRRFTQNGKEIHSSDIYSSDIHVGK